MVCNGGIRPFRNNLINLIIVSEGSDEADKWIFEKIKSEDIVVTSDIPLASKCIDKGASVLKQKHLYQYTLMPKGYQKLQQYLQILSFQRSIYLLHLILQRQ